MRSFNFDSRLIEHSKLSKTFSDVEIKNEPMLFSCDEEHARKLGGPITNLILDEMPESWKNRELIIDSRVHMLMPNWFPCIPGWHHDDVPRSLSSGQPNYYNPEYHSKHIACVVNADICPTEFALGQCNFPDVEAGQTYYKIWHPLVDKAIEYDILKKVKIKDSVITEFNWNTWHQGTRAVKNGWRFFFRATTQTFVKPKNELRRQVQVYMEAPFNGW